MITGTIPLLWPLLILPSLSDAYTWSFNNAPRQCQNVSLSIQGSGQPPYSLLMIPTGPSPLGNNEVRTIQNLPFPGSSTTLNFKLNYPANSSFVAVVSDSSSNGFGSGGTSVPVAVETSSDASCYDPSTNVQGPWTFSIFPTGGITQCESVRLWWEQPNVNGTVALQGVIPGGDSFQIPTTTLSTNEQTGTGFNWTVDVRGGTAMLIVAGDDGGLGRGGSAPYTVSYASDTSCLQADSPSSTPGSPAGGSYPTSIQTGGGGSGGGHSSNTGAIVGGVVGGVAALLIVAILALVYLRRRRFTSGTKERPVNILQDDEDDHHSRHDLPQYYEPEPFLVPDPTVAHTDGTSTHEDDARRPLSGSSASFMRPNTPGQRSMTSLSTNTRKSGMPPQLRPVNFIQHDDAGPSVPAETQEPETIELPPAYNNLRAST
ncbi:hypothetical protein BV25DRAFT_317474 [Artomyces pyxidatus]|uniref:Uncharacterized protein n=1 Tax=Artomyces pyxidatus TaxID=48021 RepID=A0ACB8T794_9AGAM|nr:hypothetical protein BV25DRAFT_317474 [Artomyces pyxidatus]